MIDSGDANSIKNDYLETLKLIIERILEKTDKKKQEDKTQISIFSGPSKVYESIGTKKPTKDSLTPEVVENIQKAINNPKEVTGTISIKVDKTEVFKVSNGQVVKDDLGLIDIIVTEQVQKAAVTSPEQAQEQKPSSVASPELNQQPHASSVASPSKTYTIDELQKQVDELKNQVSEQEKIIAELGQKPQTQSTLETLVKQIESMSESLSKQQQVIEATQSTLDKIVPMKIENTKLQNWVGAVENKVKQASNSLLETAKDKLKTVGHKINDSVRKVKGRMLETAVKTLLNKLGDRNPDGSLSFTSNKFQFSQNGDTITVKTKDGTNVLTDGAIAPELPPAVEQQVKQLPEKVFKFIDQYNQDSKQNSKLQSKPASLSR